MELFEALLAQEQVSIERFVRFRIDSPADAEDILQETYLTAYQKFSQLRNPDAFKAWVLSIARNKCTDYFRQKALRQETSFEALAESADSRYGASDSASVRETFDTLREKDMQILHFFFWEELTQEEIAKKLGIPIGTVKSRLFTAKQNFKKQYPYIFTAKEGTASMKKFPDFLPEYTIAASAEPPFALRWEELAGWFLIPRLGEKCSWGMYDIPSRKCSNLYHLQVTGKARVHGIEGVELTAEEALRQTGQHPQKLCGSAHRDPLPLSRSGQDRGRRTQLYHLFGWAGIHAELGIRCRQLRQADHHGPEGHHPAGRCRRNHAKCRLSSGHCRKIHTHHWRQGL